MAESATPTAATKKAPAKAATKKAASATNGQRSVSDAQKVAMAEGRVMSTTVSKYLDALEAVNAPKRRGRQRTPDSIRTHLDSVSRELGEASGVNRLKLIQRRIELQEELESVMQQAEPIDISEIEKEFVKVAKVFAARQGISYGALREAGVPAAVLREAGVTRAM